jgi:peptide/nickel transport system ATP-binding protein
MKADKYPFELSGGQMKRLMIARIFMLHPKVLIADEPTSMVDACSRFTILVGLAYYVSDTLYIMEKGKVVESGRAEEVILHPRHPYTQQLISDVPKIHSAWSL